MFGGINPGAPFWSGFTAFCANEATLFALDKLDVITTRNFWLSLISSTFVGGVVYGRAKVAELQEQKRRLNGANGKTR